MVPVAPYQKLFVVDCSALLRINLNPCPVILDPAVLSSVSVPCMAVLSINARHLKLVTPFQGRNCALSPRRRPCGKLHRLTPRAQANFTQATASGPTASQVANTTPDQPHGHNGYKLASKSDDNVADTGKPGKRVVIVGGGWAGKRKHLL